MKQNGSVGFEIKTVENLMRRRLDRSDELANVTRMHRWIIHYLYDHRDQAVFQRDIEAQFSIRRSTATGILKLMEKNGLLDRVSVPGDARLKRLVLTDKAIAHHEHVREEIRQLELQLTHGLTDEEISTFLQIIRKIRSNME